VAARGEQYRGEAESHGDRRQVAFIAALIAAAAACAALAWSLLPD